MVKNRFYKNTLGIFAELIIASALDTEETSGTSAQPAVTSISIGIAADPTPGDLINIVVDGRTYTHTVPVGDETTQAAHDAILALLQANDQGFEVTAHSGTTTSVYQIAWGNGAANNGKVISSTETGTTFTAFADATFAGGVSADAAASDTLEDFQADSNAGTIWAFWAEPNAAGKQEALAPGDTKNPLNAGKKFVYAWKDAAGVGHTSTPIPIRNLEYKTTAYNAGQAQISKVAYGGTISAGQILHLRITETTGHNPPFPFYSYSTPFVTDIDTTIVNLAAEVNAEVSDPIVTAEAATNTLTVTGTSKLRTFKLSAYIEVTTAYPTDASAITFPTSGTQKAIAPVGDLAFVRELEVYQNIYSGGINYAPEGTNVSEFQSNAGSNVIASVTQWGILMVYADKVDKGVVYDHTAKAYVIIAVPTGSELVLATL